MDWIEIFATLTFSGIAMFAALDWIAEWKIRREIERELHGWGKR